MDWLAAWEKQGWPAGQELTPGEALAMLALADWLEEQGRDAAAGWCRRAAGGETRPWFGAAWYDTDPVDSRDDPPSDLGQALFACLEGGTLDALGIPTTLRKYDDPADAWQGFVRAVLKLKGPPPPVREGPPPAGLPPARPARMIGQRPPRPAANQRRLPMPETMTAPATAANALDQRRLNKALRANATLAGRVTRAIDALAALREQLRAASDELMAAAGLAPAPAAAAPPAGGAGNGHGRHGEG